MLNGYGAGKTDFDETSVTRLFCISMDIIFVLVHSVIIVPEYTKTLVLI